MDYVQISQTKSCFG